MAILTLHRKSHRLVILVAFFLATSYLFLYRVQPRRGKWRPFGYVPSSFDWANRPQKYPVLESSMAHPPAGGPHRLRRIQHDFSKDGKDVEHGTEQAKRCQVVKNSFRKCWESYREYAWGYDELMPQTLLGTDTFSGWGATLVDGLDTLHIMGMNEDFEQAVQAVSTIDWDNSTARDCSLFETNIRYLGGLLAAYELSEEKVLLDKAMELAHMLYAAFDTPNRMPVNALHFGRAKEGLLAPNDREVSASVGTLSLEFTKLTQLTGQTKFYDAIDKIKGELLRTQDGTKLPGMWPTYIDLQNGFLTPDNSFTLGALSDSLYEYLPKMYAVLGGLDDNYEKMYKKAMDTARKHLLYRPMLPNQEDILFTGTVLSNGAGIIDLLPENQHLGCFTGGMFALGGKLFDLPDHVYIGEKLARGCAWAYSAFPTGIMPEVSDMVPCKTPNFGACEWNETRWKAAQWTKNPKLPPGFAAIRDPHYLLRPEAIESVFMLYRITGDRDLQEIAWKMFQSIKKATETKFAHSAITDVNVAGATLKIDSMESFWLAETLKYFYLIFSDPDHISLDDYVFNTEAHPFKIPKPK